MVRVGKSMYYNIILIIIETTGDDDGPSEPGLKYYVPLPTSRIGSAGRRRVLNRSTSIVRAQYLNNTILWKTVVSCHKAACKSRPSAGPPSPRISSFGPKSKIVIFSAVGGDFPCTSRNKPTPALVASKQP